MQQRKRTALTALTMCEAGFAGVLVAHVLSYLIVYPGTSLRTAVLAQTGHGFYQSHVPKAIIVAFLMTVLGTALLGWLDGRTVRHGRGERFAVMACTLAAIQLSGYLGLEAFERIHAGVGLTHLLAPTVLVGCALQLLIAAAAAVLLYVVRRTSSALARLFARTPRTVRAHQWPALRSTPFARRIVAEQFAPRGPPVRLSSVSI